MKIVIAGGSGFLGRALTAALLAGGHDVVILTRTAQPPGGRARAFRPCAPGPLVAHR